MYRKRYTRIRRYDKCYAASVRSVYHYVVIEHAFSTVHVTRRGLYERKNKDTRVTCLWFYRTSYGFCLKKRRRTVTSRPSISSAAAAAASTLRVRGEEAPSRRRGALRSIFGGVFSPRPARLTAGCTALVKTAYKKHTHTTVVRA